MNKKCLDCGELVETTSISDKYICGECKKKKGLTKPSFVSQAFVNKLNSVSSKEEAGK